VLHARAEEVRELTKRLEELTKDTPAWYAATRARVEVRAALEQAEELRRVLEKLGDRLSQRPASGG
jgi:predicted YcjX-like family ATPase